MLIYSRGARRTAVLREEACTDPAYGLGTKSDAQRSPHADCSLERIRCLTGKSLIVLFLLAVVSRVQAEDSISVKLAGIGSKTCSYWLSSQDRKLEGTVWIYGFSSGLNYVAASSGQEQLSAIAAMIAAVEATCRREPSRVLASATWSAYIDLNKR